MKTVITSISETIEINTADTTEPEAAFADAMHAAGIEYHGPIIADKKLHRIKVNGDRNSNGWYVLHPDGIAAGMFGDWKRGTRETWCAKSHDALTDEERAERDRRWKQQADERDAERRRMQDKASVQAQAILDAAQPATDDHPYLKRKAVKAYPGVMVGSWPQRKIDNALLVPLRTAAGKLASIEAILPNKIKIRGEDRDKDFLQGGAKAGAHFVIGDLEESPFILICEGYATAATVHEATGYAAVMACDAGNLANVTAALKALYPHPKVLMVCGDNDRRTDGNPGQKAALAVSKKAKVRVCIPDFADDEDGSDFNDLAALHGIDRVWNEIESALHGPWRAGKEGVQHGAAAQAVVSEPQRPVIEVVSGTEHTMADEAERLLLEHDPTIFQRGERLVRWVPAKLETVHGIRRPAGAAIIRKIEIDYLMDRLSTFIQWMRFDVKENKLKQTKPPERVAKNILVRFGQWKFPLLTGIITAPTMRPDGSILDKAGYDAETGLLFVNQGLSFPEIPLNPSKEQAAEALAILADVFNSFPFVKEYHKSAVLSAALSVCVRHILRCIPLHSYSAPAAGSGKSLLADTISMIGTGYPAPAMALSEDQAEMNKTITAVLIQGDAVINLDNIEHGESLAGRELSKAITQEVYSGRILGKTETVNLAATCMWLATGNQLQISGDMTRRVIPCEIDPACERPDEREFKRNLYEWVPANRPQLVAAALTILRAYIVAGRPRQNIRPLGGFEDWSSLVRSSLIWLGYADPLSGRDEIESADPQKRQLRALLEAWFGVFRTAEATCKEAIFAANQSTMSENRELIFVNPELKAVLYEFFKDKDGGINSEQLGRYISRNNKRLESGLRFEKAGISHNATQWRVTPTSQKGEVREVGEVSPTFAGNFVSETFKNTNETVKNTNLTKTPRSVGKTSQSSPTYPNPPKVPLPEVCQPSANYPFRYVTKCAKPTPIMPEGGYGTPIGCSNCGQRWGAETAKPGVRP